MFGGLEEFELGLIGVEAAFDQRVNVALDGVRNRRRAVERIGRQWRSLYLFRIDGLAQAFEIADGEEAGHAMLVGVVGVAHLGVVVGA